MTTFVLIRHAESAWSADEERPLTVAGRQAADVLPARLDGHAITAIYSSPYRRARETVSPLATRLGLPISEVRDLRERTLGSFAGSFEDAVAATWSDFAFAHPGGESSRDAQERALAVVGSVARRHPGETVVLASHGNLLALLLHRFDPRIGFEFWKSMALPDVFELLLAADETGSFRRLGS